LNKHTFCLTMDLGGYDSEEDPDSGSEASATKTPEEEHYQSGTSRTPPAQPSRELGQSTSAEEVDRRVRLPHFPSAASLLSNHYDSDDSAVEDDDPASYSNIPPSPKTKCSKELQAKVNSFMKRDEKFNKWLKTSKAFKNPQILTKTAQVFGIRQHGTNLVFASRRGFLSKPSPDDCYLKLNQNQESVVNKRRAKQAIKEKKRAQKKTQYEKRRSVSEQLNAKLRLSKCGVKRKSSMSDQIKAKLKRMGKSALKKSSS